MAHPALRRTQADRREGTIRKLLDAGAAALVEVGYAGASVQEICGRAGVSHGGMFRHFASREELLVAVAGDLGKQILADYERRFRALAYAEDPLAVALTLLRETCRSRPNQALYELAIAARTSPRLRKAISKTTVAYYRTIGAVARALLPELAASLGDSFDVLVDTIIAIFDGEQIHRFLGKKSDFDQARIDLLIALIPSAKAATRKGPRKSPDT